jgi:Arc/MetJ-type ribon-helix-helix transcriptional regulator
VGEITYTVRLEEEQRDEWADFVEESDFSSTSQLVRTAVSEYIQRDSDDHEFEKELRDVNNEIINEISQVLQGIEEIGEIVANIDSKTELETISEVTYESSLEALKRMEFEDSDEEGDSSE